MSQIVDEVVAANKKYASNFSAKKDCAAAGAWIRDTDLYGRAS
jgi:hypothetical protein